MLMFLIRRFGTMLVTLAAISVLIFGIINLPEGKHLVIDSKVSLTSYEKYFN